MTVSIRLSLLLGVLALILGCSVLTGALPSGPQRAIAADETTEETTTTPEEPPPVVETPTEPETTPEPETTTPTPPVTTPPVGTPDESGSAPVVTPKPTPSTGSGSSGGGSVVAGGGSGSSAPSGSSGSTGSSSGGGAATTTPATAPSRHASRTQTRTSSGGGNSTGGGGGGSKTGGGGSRDTGAAGGGGGHRAPSHPHSSGGPAPQPTVSPQSIDRGASAVSNAASHAGEAFAKALPTAPLKKIGDRLAAQIAGATKADGAKGGKKAVEGIGTALGAALLGSAVAVDKAPQPSSSPIPFFTPPGGKSATIYLILIAALVLAVGALVFREVRSALGLDAPRTGVRVADEKPRISTRERLGVALAGAQGATQHWFGRFRRLRANAAAGLRSLF